MTAFFKDIGNNTTITIDLAIAQTILGSEIRKTKMAGQVALDRCRGNR
jgi:hypothetical protein